MPKFPDTPKWKREMRWDSELQQLVLPPRQPTHRQINYIGRLCAQHGFPFTRPKTRQEASGVIDRLKAGTCQPDTTWRLGVGQTREEERWEMRDAKHCGLEREYMQQQRWQRMREAELERRRERKQIQKHHSTQGRNIK
jgi:hypothetical protein